MKYVSFSLIASVLTLMERDKIFTRNLEGKMIEIGNWEARSSDGDAFVGVPLTDSGLLALRAGRSSGKSDQQIFQDIHHSRRPRYKKHTMTLDDLTTHQVLVIAHDLLGEEIASLSRLSRTDLIRLVKKLATIKKVTIELDLSL